MTERARRRRHPAQGSRIAAAGFGVSAMLGLVGVMGYANRSSAASAAPTPVEAVQDLPPQIVVVVHQRAAETMNDATSTSAPTNPPPTNGPPATNAVAATPTPIPLEARTVVLPPPPTVAPPAPVARTHASR